MEKPDNDHATVQEGNMTRRQRIRTVSSLALVALAVFFVWQFLVKGQKTGAASAKTNPGSEASLLPIAVRWENSIAVLPFADLSPQKDQDYLCDGMTDEIITRLANIASLKVISHTSVMHFKENNKDNKKIGRELGVKNILQGSVRRENENIHVTAQLIRISDDSRLWSEAIDDKLESLLHLQDRVALAIAKTLAVRFSEKSLQDFKLREPRNIKAFEWYAQGMYTINNRYVLTGNKDDFSQALQMFQQAIAVDTEYPLAYVGLAWAYNSRSNMDTASKDYRDDELVEKYLRAAIRFAPELPEANAGIGSLYLQSREYDKAYPLLLKAVKANPNHPVILASIGDFFRYQGLLQRAFPYYQRWHELDPLAPMALTNMAICHEDLGDLEQSNEMFKKCLEINPRLPAAYFHNAVAMLKSQRLDEAEKQVAKALQIAPRSPDIPYLKATLAAARGKKEEALAYQKQTDEPSLGIFSQLGMKDEAIAVIRERHKIQPHFYYYLHLIHNLFYDNLRSDPRFQEIVKEEKAFYDERTKMYRDL